MKTNPSLIKCENPFPEGAEVLTCQRGLYYQDQFMILAGTNAGQLLCINPDNLKKRSMILQAHAAPIQHLHVSKHNSMLFTSDNNTLKIWDIRFREPGKKVQGLENPPQTPSTLSLELVTMKETSSLFSNVMAVDEAQKTIAIASKDARIAFYSFGNNRISQIRQRGQENHTSNVTAIDANEKLGLFASSSSDGSVKIWKNARLIRYYINYKHTNNQAH